MSPPLVKCQNEIFHKNLVQHCCWSPLGVLLLSAHFSCFHIMFHFSQNPGLAVLSSDSYDLNIWRVFFWYVCRTFPSEGRKGENTLIQAKCTGSYAAHGCEISFLIENVKVFLCPWFSLAIVPWVMMRNNQIRLAASPHIAFSFAKTTSRVG